MAGHSAIVLAADHNTVDSLARRLRAARIAVGEVEPGGIAAGEQVVGVGDEIVTLRNDRRLVTSRDGWVRNGDRWRIDECHSDGSLNVPDLARRGQLSLPADYAAEHVSLGYALTIHKAQGVTVDHGILIAGDHLSAEALYVAMTRGRRDNTALVITDDLPLDDHNQDQPVAPSDILAGALARPTVERAALDHLRDSLERSESLATLAPRLANLDAWIAEHAPADRTAELARAQHQLDHAEHYARPGVLTRVGRADRHRLADLTERRNELADAQDDRQSWFAENADTLDYRQQVAAQIADRRRQLGIDAVERQPDHLVELLGPLPDGPYQTDRWQNQATRIEAYREEWGVQPDEILDRPVDWVQARQWELSVGDSLDTRDLLDRLDFLQHDRPQDHDLDLDFGVDF